MKKIVTHIIAYLAFMSASSINADLLSASMAVQGGVAPASQGSQTLSTLATDPSSDIKSTYNYAMSHPTVATVNVGTFNEGRGRNPYTGN